MLSTCWEMRNDYADSHPKITSIQSLIEAHSSVTPGQGAERPQPGELGEQRKSASGRLTSIFDAHSQRGTCRQSLVCGAPGRPASYAQQLNYTLNVGTYLGASASGGAPSRGPFTNVSKPHLLLGYLLAVHLAMRIKDASQPLRG